MKLRVKLPGRLHFGRFTRDEDGAVTVEFVLWLPVFFLILMLIVDATMVFSAEARLWTVARDAARQISIHRLSAEDAEEFVHERSGFKPEKLTVTADDSKSDIWVRVTTPTSEVDMFGFFGTISSPTLVAHVTLRAEPT